jgi:hypothetical protein
MGREHPHTDNRGVLRAAQERHPGRLPLGIKPVAAVLSGRVCVALQPSPRLAAYVLDDARSGREARSSFSADRFVVARWRSRRKSCSVCFFWRLRTSCSGVVGLVLTGRLRAGILSIIRAEGGGHDPQPTVTVGPLGSKAGPPPWRFPLQSLAGRPRPSCSAQGSGDVLLCCTTYMCRQLVDAEGVGNSGSAVDEAVSLLPAMSAVITHVSFGSSRDGLVCRVRAFDPANCENLERRLAREELDKPSFCRENDLGLLQPVVLQVEQHAVHPSRIGYSANGTGYVSWIHSCPLQIRTNVPSAAPSSFFFPSRPEE